MLLVDAKVPTDEPEENGERYWGALDLDPVPAIVPVGAAKKVGVTRSSSFLAVRHQGRLLTPF
jgi:hypothetical protein